MKTRRITFAEHLFVWAVLLALAATEGSGEVINYTYDSLNRLANVNGGNGSVISYTYDAAGNRLTYSGVVANDSILPTISITSLTPGQRLTTNSNIYRVKGTATDNAGVAQVLVKLNTNDWQVLGGLSPWQIDEPLAPGPNTVWAYAVDMAGNRSLTNTVTFTYVVTNRLILHTNGVGTITRNGFSGDILEQGQNYSLTAVPGTGFRLTNWTDETCTVLSTQLTLPFRMRPGLEVTANLVDYQAPGAVTISSPLANARISNSAVVSVSGKAGDNGTVRQVWYQAGTNAAVAGPDWQVAGGTTNWVGPDAVLAPGTNWLRVYSEDAAGNRGPTNKQMVYYVVTNRLILHTNGVGTITRNGFSGDILEQGQNYSLTAVPGTGFRLTNWTDQACTVLSTQVTLAFRMRPGLEVTANLVDYQAPGAVTISSPLPNARISNSAVVTVSGKASDNGALRQVWYQAGTNVGVAGPDWQVAGGTTNWVGPDAVLAPGTNWLRVYSEDTAGNRGPTNKQMVYFVVTNRLILHTNGVGTITRNGFSGDILEQGQNYSLTAVPGTGFRLTNWTDQACTVLSTQLTLAFRMRPGLEVTANLVDYQAPGAVTISSPLANARVSNSAVVTVSGKASDNGTVRQVWYQAGTNAAVAGPDWQVAAGTTNWVGSNAVLAPGTNWLRVYSEDTAGNRGPTNKQMVYYVVTNRLILYTNGVGTITRNGFSGDILEQGQNYSLTAVPGTGFRLTNWTDQACTVLSTQITLVFRMSPGLEVTANLVDYQAPGAVTISSPLPSARISNSAVVSVSGKASDNGTLRQVWYQAGTSAVLAGPDWQAAVGTTNWTGTNAALLPGTNWLRVYAEDGAGNRGPTNKQMVYYVVTNRLILRTNGVGTITRNGFSGDILEQGQNYTVTATPGSGQVFSNWSGTISAWTNVLTFVMQSNMVLQANFVPNPFVAVKGSYNGLFYPPDGTDMMVDATNSGFVTLTITDQGAVSGQVRMEGTSYPFSGTTLRADLTAEVPVPRTGKTPLMLYLSNSIDTASVLASVMPNVHLPPWYAGLEARLAASGMSNRFAGTYTVAVEGGSEATNSPPGSSPLTVTVSAAGQLTMSGTLADGSPAISQSVAISTNGFWPCYASLYGGRGILLGWLALDTSAPPGQTLRWVKPPTPADKIYPLGFQEDREVLIQRYVAPRSGQNVVNWTKGWGQVTINLGNGPQLTSYVVVSNNQVRVWGGSISNLVMTITPASGLFNGSFTHPVTHGKSNFFGVFMPPTVAGQDVLGGGWFLGTNQGGMVMCGPTTQELWEAPSSIAGALVRATPDGAMSGSTLCFGASTVAIDLPVAIGSYAYTKLSATAMRITLTLTAPSYNAGKVTITASLATPSDGTYVMVRAADGQTTTGTFHLQSQSANAPATVANLTASMHDASGLFTVSLGATTFSTSTGGSGTYAYTRYGSGCGVVTLNFSVPSAYAGRQGYAVMVFNYSTEGFYGIGYPALPTAPLNYSVGWFSIP